MSNLSLFSSGAALPDYFKTETDALTRSLAGSTGGKSISIKGGVWRMMVGGEEVAKNEDRAMNFVIVAAAPKVSRTFYIGKYEEGKDSSPVCWSADGDAPATEVPAAQKQSVSCKNCPQNIEGSGEGKSRACRFAQRFAVVVENDISGNVYRLQLPAKSLFGKAEGDKMSLQAYAKFLAGHGVPITGVVTEARFDTSEAVPVLRFKAVRPLKPTEWEAAKTQSMTDDAKQAVEFKMVVKGAAAAVPALPSAFKEAVVEAPVVADAEAEPVKRAKKSEPAAAPAKDLASALSQWSTDDDE